MSGKRVSIAQVMILVALAAVNLAVIRAAPLQLLITPAPWIPLGILDFLIVWKLILQRSLRAFDYTFLIVVFSAFLVMANLVAGGESLHPLAFPVRWYQQLSGEKINNISLIGFVWLGVCWAVGFMSLALACAAGWVAARLERRRAWDIAAFWRGALVGFLVVGLLATIDDMAWGWVQLETFSIRWIGRTVLLGAGVILGGWLGLSRLKSSRRDPQGRTG